MREILFSTTTERFLVFPTNPPAGVESRTPIDIEATIRVVPAPAPVALLGLALVIGARRRRAPARPASCRNAPAD